MVCHGHKKSNNATAYTSSLKVLRRYMIYHHDSFIIEAGCVLCEVQTGTLVPADHRSCLFMKPSRNTDCISPLLQYLDEGL